MRVKPKLPDSRSVISKSEMNGDMRGIFFTAANITTKLLICCEG
jgi:hypothetical protein